MLNLKIKIFFKKHEMPLKATITLFLRQDYAAY